MNNQKKTPIYDALLKYKKNRIVSFDVPGHKQGKGHKALLEAFGEQCLSLDYNSSKPLDNLTHPTGVIYEGEKLMAEAFGAHHAFFMIGGTTSAVQTMIFNCCKQGEKIILPRNVHKSAINALVLCGAIPIYVNPGINTDLGISLGMSVDNIKEAIKANPDAKAIFVNNPTYYGVCSNLKEIVKLAHKAGMKVLVDEAHGTHFYFGKNLPVSAMEAGADMAAVSMHKTGGSLTQSSIVLIGESMDENEVRQIINLTQTTSGSYLLMASVDIARKNLALYGEELFLKIMKMSQYAREEVNKIQGLYAFGQEIIDGDCIYDFDSTKLSIHTRKIGLAGIEVYDLLRDEFGIQIEFGDLGNILAIISVGDRQLEIERLLGALSETCRRFKKDPMGLLAYEYINPVVVMEPQKAFNGNKKAVAIEDSEGYISGEFVMAYPPGIPILAPGELITKEIMTHILYSKEKGCVMMGTKDMDMKSIEVMEV